MDFPTPEGIAAFRAFVDNPAFGGSSAWQAGVRGVVLGLGAAMPIGPVNVEIARRVLRAGFLTGVALGCGAVTIDVVYAILSTLSFVRMLEHPMFVLPVAATGALFLTFMGVQCLRAARAALRSDPLVAAGEDAADPADVTEQADPGERPTVGVDSRAVRAAYATGLLMTLLNPMTLAFWFTVVPAAGASVAGPPASAGTVGAVGTSGGGSGGGGDLPMLCAGVFVGTVAWVVSFAGLLAVANRAAGRNERRQRRWLAAADAVGGAALLTFACLAAAEFWRRLSPLL